MSRVGKKIIPIPKKTQITLTDGTITVQGTRGTLTRTLHPAVDIQIEKEQVQVSIRSTDRISRSLHGLTRTLVANMVKGVSDGFERILEINGIGYRAEVSGNSIIMNLGYSQPVHFMIPEGVTAVVEKNTVLKLFAIDKEKLGHTVAAIRRLRPPEPYKGKGIKFTEEHIHRKAGKTGTK